MTKQEKISLVFSSIYQLNVWVETKFESWCREVTIGKLWRHLPTIIFKMCFQWCKKLFFFWLWANRIERILHFILTYTALANSLFLGWWYHHPKMTPLMKAAVLPQLEYCRPSGWSDLSFGHIWWSRRVKLPLREKLKSIT